MPDVARARWEAATDRPLVAAAVLFLGVYAWPILQPDLSPTARTACRVVAVVVYVAFAVDLAVRVGLSQHRGRFLVRHWLDVVSLALPMLRPLQVLRVLLALNVLGRRGHSLARSRVVVFVAAAVVVVAFVAALAELDVERPAPGATITTFGDALWWAATTVTTVGYGDVAPVTAQGRVVAVALMVTGIALAGVVTASIASWFVERLSASEEADDRAEAQVAELLQEVRALRAELRERDPRP